MGVQAFSSSVLRVLGNIARIFTLFVEVDDFFLKFNVLLAASLNFAVLMQFFFYPSQPSQKVEDSEATAENPKEKNKKVKRD